MKGTVVQLAVDHALIRPGALSSALLAWRRTDADALVTLPEAPEATEGTLAEAAAAVAERFREAAVGAGGGTMAAGVGVIFLLGLLGAGMGRWNTSIGSVGSTSKGGRGGRSGSTSFITGVISNGPGEVGLVSAVPSSEASSVPSAASC